MVAGDRASRSGLVERCQPHESIRPIQRRAHQREGARETGALYSLIAVMVGRRFYASPAVDSSDPFLNDRSARMVGKVVTVVEPVDPHGGRVRVGDSEWSARGGPAAAGEKVRITGVEGNCLTVEAERILPPA